MSSLNRVQLIGNLGGAPELKYLPSGKAVCEMRIATNETYKDNNGQKQERVEWHRVKVWGKTGEACAQYLDKGRSVYVEGRIETRSWDDKNTGEKRYATEIVASDVKFLGGEGGGRARGRSKPPTDDLAPPDADDMPPARDLPAGDDDIPF
jgi:single-strand DNA-binding protein